MTGASTPSEARAKEKVPTNAEERTDIRIRSCQRKKAKETSAAPSIGKAFGR